MQYKFWGKVQHGAKRGRLLGFPTANMRLHKKIPEGIYISQAILKNKIYESVTFIGNAKTFGEKDYKAETYILDFTKHIYAQWVSVTLLKKIRINERFDSQKALVIQIEKDVLAAREFFSKLH